MFLFWQIGEKNELAACCLLTIFTIYQCPLSKLSSFICKKKKGNLIIITVCLIYLVIVYLADNPAVRKSFEILQHMYTVDILQFKILVNSQHEN